MAFFVGGNGCACIVAAFSNAGVGGVGRDPSTALRMTGLKGFQGDESKGEFELGR